MSSPEVLSVGQCGFDHSRIANHLRQSFGARVRGVSTFDEAMEALRGSRYDLVLVNRINDEDGASGLDLIRRVKSEPALAEVPIMLVSNYAEAQQQAEALGALPGFGKSELTATRTQARLGSVLGGSRDSGAGGAVAERAEEY